MWRGVPSPAATAHRWQHRGKLVSCSSESIPQKPGERRRLMAQNMERWLLDRDNFPWAQEHVPLEQWYQLGKYFPGAALRRDMKYVDAATGAVIDQAGHAEVPPGRVFLYRL